MDQFVTRFLLRETVSQLLALQTSLEGASDTLEAQARGQRYVMVLPASGMWVPVVPEFQTQYSVPSSLPEATFLGRGHELLREGVSGFGAGLQRPRRPVLPT